MKHHSGTTEQRKIKLLITDNNGVNQHLIKSYKEYIIRREERFKRVICPGEYALESNVTSCLAHVMMPSTKSFELCSNYCELLCPNACSVLHFPAFSPATDLVFTALPKAYKAGHIYSVSDSLLFSLCTLGFMHMYVICLTITMRLFRFLLPCTLQVHLNVSQNMNEQPSSVYFA